MMPKGIRSGRQRGLVEAALAAGWDWRMGGSGHLLLVSPNGDRVVISTTKNDRGHEWRNNRAVARRAGLDV